MKHAHSRPGPSRGRDLANRGSSPSSSSANSELVRAGFKPPTISKKGYTDVRVHQPNTPSKFSCQILTRREELEELTDRMMQVYERGDEEDYMEDEHILPYAPCAVLLETSWQRGYILSSSCHGCQVVMVDTQEVRSVDPDQLRSLREQFMKLPAQGVKCTLAAINCKSNNWKIESCRYFKELVSENEFIVEFRSDRGGSWNVMLHSYVSGADQLVNAMFVVKGWASSTDKTVREAVDDLNAAKTSPFQMYQVAIGSLLPVCACHVEGPGEFYVQLLDSQQPIDDLCDKMQDYYSSNNADKAKLNIDNYVAAMWDDAWYRGKIVSVARTGCEVFFLDYGNTDVIDTTNIRGLAKKFMQQPMYAIRCKLDGIDPNLMEQMSELFTDLVNPETEQELVFHATFIKQDKEGYLVSLYDGTVPLLQKMFQIMYSSPGADMIRKSRPARPSHESSVHHPFVPLPKKDLAQMSHARDPTLLRSTMSPNVFVPMNFGIQLLDSPTHSTLELKASQGAVIPASSVILSFNSPVIDHMTTTLHLTSVDMEEFSEDAVRYFVNAAYSGESPPISRVLFRDINKLANVFEMSWLANRCVDQFKDMIEAIQEALYEDLIFLFDEAVYVLSNLKSRQLVEVTLTKIQSLNGESQRDFISRYLQNLTSLSCQQLDLIIELTKTNVEYIVKPITEQITATSSDQGTLDLTNFKYTLENIDLSYCLKNNIQLYERLFGMLEERCGTNDDLRWLLRLQRKLFKESVLPKESGIAIATTSAYGVAECSDSNIIPNMFHTLNTTLTFDEVVDWLGTSDEVSNFWMFFEGIWTWMNANERSPVKCSPNFLNKFREIRKKRKWREVEKSFLNSILHKSESSREFFQAIMSCEDLCLRDAGWNIVFNKGEIKDIFSVFEQETKLYFICQGHHSVYNIMSNCTKPGKCGFVLKTVPAKEHANFVLSTDPNDYSEEIHYHNEIHAKDMHLEMEWFKELKQPSGWPGYYLPMSWAGRPVYQNNEILWDKFPVTDYGKNDSYCFCLFFPTLDK